MTLLVVAGVVIGLYLLKHFFGDALGVGDDEAKSDEAAGLGLAGHRRRRTENSPSEEPTRDREPAAMATAATAANEDREGAGAPSRRPADTDETDEQPAAPTSESWVTGAGAVVVLLVLFFVGKCGWDFFRDQRDQQRAATRQRELAGTRWSEVRRVEDPLKGPLCLSSVGPVRAVQQATAPPAQLIYFVQGGDESLRIVLDVNPVASIGLVDGGGFVELLFGKGVFAFSYRIDGGDLESGVGLVADETEAVFPGAVLRAVKNGSATFVVGVTAEDGEYVYRFGIAGSRFEEVRSCAGG